MYTLYIRYLGWKADRALKKADQPYLKAGWVKLPGAARGRCWVRPETGEPDRGETQAAKSEPMATISARVKRADTGEWEDLGVIAHAAIRQLEDN
jgi:hypothetical protein